MVMHFSSGDHKGTVTHASRLAVWIAIAELRVKAALSALQAVRETTR